MPPTRVLLVDDHALFREGLAAILEAQPDFQVVGEAADGLEANLKARELKPDLVLMDVQMPGMDGVTAVSEILRHTPQTIIVMLTVRSDDDSLFAALKAGAKGYLLKEMRARDLVEALRGTLQGEAALSPSLAARVLQEFRRLSQSAGEQVDAPSDVDFNLTHREQDVLNQIVDGLTDKEIAQTLSISVYTVKSHVRNILGKLQAHNRYEAAQIARRRGLTS